MLKKKLIVVLIDGVSADYVRDFPENLPNICALAQSGVMVDRLSAVMPGTSMPGRACMLTGQLGADNGVYGNHLLKGAAFLPADAGDLTVPTIASLARNAGLFVAGVGAGMVGAEDTSLFVPPAWLRRFLDKSRFAKEIPEDRFSRAREIRDPSGHLERMNITNPFMFPPSSRITRETPPVLAGYIADQLMIRTATALACSASPPDVIFTEICATDTLQHTFGYSSEAAHSAAAFADALIGSMVNQIRNAGRFDDYSFAIASDHGHDEIRTSIYPDAILPGLLWQSEGATMHVAVRNEQDARHIGDVLSEFGVERWSNDHIPLVDRAQIATFIAPKYHSFDAVAAGITATEKVGPPRNVSTHGFRPGDPSDDRFCVFAGGQIPRDRVATAMPEQYAATIARLMDIRAPGMAEALL